MSTQARRAQLLRCAVEASADVGISRVGHVDVAERAHVSVPTVFAYFPTRQILVRAILRDVRRFYLELLRSVPREGKATDVAYALFWECTRRARTEPHYIRVWLDWSTAIREEIWQRYLKLWNEGVAEFKAVLDRGQRAGEIDRGLDTLMAARIVLGGAHTIGVMLFSGVDDAELEALARHLVSGALHPSGGVAAREGSRRLSAQRRTSSRRE
jgi:TetR/AcrR family hemagglutinin/protease transcriptional regulator